ncbi:SpaA isopeptide-forming pilin-related protein [Proteinivorax hydrogeniformans]|uniref:SpaA isopeptide-forming pilin-related protein n=1 Tax=Proteinivorax hydrogeniformans TaxID=1826727 RepID=A0AAU8HTI3_9FIRM
MDRRKAYRERKRREEMEERGFNSRRRMFRRSIALSLVFMMLMPFLGQMMPEGMLGSGGYKVFAGNLSNEDIIFEKVIFTDNEGNEYSADYPYNLNAAETGRLEIKISLPDDHEVKAGDTYTFNLPNEFDPVSATNGLLGSIGTWTVTADGVVTFTFNENVEGDNVEAEFWFAISLNEEELSDEIVQEIEFENIPGFSISFPVVPKGGTLIDKAGTINNEGFNSSEAYWRVDINTVLDEMVHPSVVDVIPDNMKYQIDSLEIIILEMTSKGDRKEGDPLDDDKYQVTVDENGDLKIEFINLTEEELKQAYRITYTTDIVEPEEGFDGTQTFANNATLTSDGEESKPAVATVSSGFGRAIEKADPDYKSGDQAFEWKINYNYNEKFIQEEFAWIEDTWSPDGVMELDQDKFKIYPVTIDENGNATVDTGNPISSDLFDLEIFDGDSGFKVTFDQDIDTQAYQIQYTTKLLGSQGTGIVDEGGSVTNTVTTGTEKTDGSSGNWGQQGIIKEHIGTDIGNKEMTWEIKLNQNSYLMENLVLTDTFIGDGMTLDEDSVAIHKDDESEFTNYDLTYTPPTPGNPGGFKIEFNELIKEPLTLTLTTNFERNSDGTATYKNQAKIEWEEDDKSYKISTGEIKGEDTKCTATNGVKFGTYNAVEQKITWEVNTNYARLPIELDYIITDEIPENQELVEGSLEVYSYEVDAAGKIFNRQPLSEGEYETKLPSDSNDQTLTVTLDNEFKDKRTAIGIRFKTKFENDLIEDDEVVNTATVTSGKNEFTLEAKVSVPFGGEYATKSGEQTGEFNERIDWEVYLNPNQSRIKDYKLVDNPDLNSILLEETFFLYKASVNEDGVLSKEGEPLIEGEDYNITIETDGLSGKQNFELTFPDEITEAYILEYSSYIDPLAPQGEEITNTFTATGLNVETIESEDGSKVTKSNAGGGDGSSVRGGLEITKTDESEEILLEGALFHLYTKDGNQLLRSGTTDADGKVVFGGLRRGDYLLKEIEAPAGYIISDELAEGIVVTLSHEGEGELLNWNEHNAFTKVRIEKVNQNDQIIEKEVKFDLYNANDDLIKQNIVAEEGVITIEDLPQGAYYLIETAAPEGYILNTEPVEFTISINDDGTQSIPIVNIVNYQGSVEISKKDEAGNPLEGARFRLETSSGSIVHENLTSNSNGIVEINDLAPGTYQLIETQAADGYIRNTEEISITIPDRLSGEPQVFEYDYTNYQGRVRLIKTDASGNPLAGAEYEIKDENGEAVFSGLTTAEDGRLLVTGISPGKYSIVEVKAPEGYIIDSTPMHFEINATNEGEPSIVVLGDWKNYQGSVELVKEDTQGNKLQGAVFSLFDQYDNLIYADLETGEDGVLMAENLAPGDYYFVETKAPDGYVINTEKISFSITSEAEGVPETVEAGTAINYQGSVELHKEDVDGNPLAGAIFTIEDGEENIIQTGLKSDENGRVFAEDLAPGDYYFVETKAAEGFIRNEVPVAFTIEGSAEGKPVVVNSGNMINYQGSVQWQKVDEAGESLAGAVFKLEKQVNDDYRIIHEDITGDENGRFSINNLEPGDYRLTEVNSEEGYILNTEAITFTISGEAKGKPETLVLDAFVNYQGKAQLIKTDKEGAPLPGAEFKLLMEDEVIKEKLISDAEGKILVTGLAPGEYSFVETKAPGGFMLDQSHFSFTIEAKTEGEPTVVSVGHAMNYQGAVQLQKVDQNGKAVSNAVFEIRDQSGNLIMGELKSNNEGVVLVENLAPGEYIIQEIKAPDGYIINPEPLFFTIDMNTMGEPKVLDLGEFVNEFVSLRILKTDSETNQPLRGATFKLTDESGENTWTLTTGEDGTAMVEGLLFGTYTIKEMEAPSGYQLDDEIHTIMIDDSKVIFEWTAVNHARIPIDDETPRGPELPKTGQQSTLLYVIMGMAIMASGLFLATRKKRKNNNE